MVAIGDDVPRGAFGTLVVLPGERERGDAGVGFELEDAALFFGDVETPGLIETERDGAVALVDFFVHEAGIGERRRGDEAKVQRGGQ